MKTLADIGERNAIARISKIINTQYDGFSIGDDCAILPMNDEYLLISTDMVAKYTHLSSNMSSWQIGWFLVAVNLSDIAAKGGTPYGLVLALGLPRDLPVSSFDELIQGAHDCARAYNTRILGGDTKESKEMVLTGTVFGAVKKNEFMARKGARVSDVIAVTGYIGKAAAGMLALEEKIRFEETVLKGLFEPKPRIEAGRILAQSGCIHCCMDISDGISTSLYQLQQQNAVGFRIDSSHLPISLNLQKMFNKTSDKNMIQYALQYGGDYELLCTLSPDDFAFVQSQLEQISVPFTQIGLVTKNKEILYQWSGKLSPLFNEGYEHFTSKASNDPIR